MLLALRGNDKYQSQNRVYTMTFRSLFIQENVVAKAFWKKIIDRAGSDIEPSQNDNDDLTYVFSV
mgnify:CR=1 FL=1